MTRILVLSDLHLSPTHGFWDRPQIEQPAIRALTSELRARGAERPEAPDLPAGWRTLR
jgi:hypothetical protein